nr:hypothetical protein [Pseudomonas aeruginosa]
MDTILLRLPKFPRNTWRHAPEFGYLYVYAIGVGIYKIGRTNNIYRRYITHRKTFGGDLVAAYVVNDPVDSERQILNIAWSAVCKHKTKALQALWNSREVFAIPLPDSLWVHAKMREMRFREEFTSELQGVLRTNWSVLAREEWGGRAV